MTSTIDTILFDLDGTLLPLDQERFARGYFSLFAQESSSLGYDVPTMVKGLQAGFGAILTNDGSMTNKERFDRVFEEATGYESEEMNTRFLPFYEGLFEELKEFATPSPVSRTIIDTLTEKGYRLVLATNPLFPRIGTLTRMKWAALTEADFELITTYEEFSYAKPNLGYYEEIMSSLNLNPKQCLMVGNDVEEDMVALTMGMEAYLVTDCLLNPKNQDLSSLQSGSLNDFARFAQEKIHDR